MSEKVAVVGLGYVGLPVAVALAEKHPVVGFDINQSRVNELKDGFDKTGEVSETKLKKVKINYSSDPQCLAGNTVFIVTVPTPIDAAKRPDLYFIESASKIVGKYLTKGSIVVYESTVYPGATREICLPILEKESGLKFGEDFALGYSPERINPGDKVHRFEKIVKVVSASDDTSLKRVAELYGSVVEAGTYQAPSIEVAEAAKVIENTQRDLNVALINELSMIFDRLGIDTRAVLDAASTKWNFLRFDPGLVGGHCIGVDPYYLTYKAENVGYIPQVILSGRRVNDDMSNFIVSKLVKTVLTKKIPTENLVVSIMGLTFKENCPDIRNSKVFDIIRQLKTYGFNLQIHDPRADADEVYDEMGVRLVSFEELKKSSVVLFCVAHEEFKNLDQKKLEDVFGPISVLFDVKGIFNKSSLGIESILRL